MQGTLCGGKSATSGWDGTAQGYLDQHREEILEKLGNKNATIEPVHYTTQVVNGTNYFLTVKVDGQVKEIRIHQALPCYGNQSTLGEIKNSD